VTDLVRWFRDISAGDVAVVGGKNASLGEMIGNLADLGVAVPDGFATTAAAYRVALAFGGLDTRIADRVADLDVEDVEALTAAGAEIRRWIGEAELPADLAAAISQAYRELAGGEPELPVAVRSSATAEDLPDASFAGQQETYLNVRGIDSVLAAVRDVFASLYNDRAIAYRVHRGYRHDDVAISAGIQHMVRSAVSGVAFTIDTESGFDGAVFVTAGYGLGELLVQGAIDPDEYYVAKANLDAGRPAVLSRTLGTKHRKMVYGEPGTAAVVTEAVSAADRRRFALSDAELEELARHVVTIERHYGMPMDVEWARDESDGRLYILQARPETVQSREGGRVLERYRLTGSSRQLATGRSVGQRIGSGIVRVVRTPAEMERVREGDVLVADMTDPDWEPVMKRAAAIVTNRGGRTCHAAIIARELGIPAVVGTGDATEVLVDGDEVTVSCAEGDTGVIYAGNVGFERTEVQLDAMPEAPTKIMMNVASPSRAFAFSRIPNHGVGLARIEFIINNVIGVHPRALLDHATLPDDLRAEIDERIAGYPDAESFFVDKLTEGIATIAAAFHPKAVIVRLSDFKSNEYAHLLGGDRYEPREENPMIGFRGASRYRAESFADAFALECRALRRVRDTMGYTNVEVMVPFVRTVAEAEDVVAALASNGIRRGENDLRLIMMCEIPSNALLADEFLDHFDGFSIGSNDLTQFTLALDRDSELVAPLFDERNPAVKQLIRMATDACHARGKYIGICGQGPSDHPDLARWLVEIGLDSLSLNPDTVVATWLDLAAASADG
jgi:pyruvate,water dikinase